MDAEDGAPKLAEEKVKHSRCVDSSRKWYNRESIEVGCAQEEAKEEQN